MAETFDQISYWRDRHNKLRGDHRATGNISRSPEQMLQRKIVQAYFFFSVVQAILWERSGGAVGAARAAPATPPEVLDIGFGTGFLGSLLVRGGIRYTGYDLSEVAAEDSAAMCPEGHYLIRNIVREPAEKSDVIIASEVLFHIVDDAQWRTALDNIAAGLRPTSVLMFTETFVEKITPGPPHFKPRTRAMYEEAMAASGLRFARPDELGLTRLPVFDQYVPFRRSLHFVLPADRPAG
jgi:2-polyprenyl-3-methyl-5-hydroxy-6-metoxy-1,4-benzoquinol methylase